MDQEQLTERIVALAAGLPPAALRGEAIAPANEELYFDALEAFGSWEGALAHALCAAVRSLGAASPQSRSAPSAPVDIAVALAAREVDPDALRTVLVLTSRGHLMRFGGDAFPTSVAPAPAGPPAGWPEAIGRPLRFLDKGALGALLAVCDDGRAFGYDARIVPDLTEDDEIRRLGVQSGVDRWVTVLDRSPIRRDGLFVTVTRAGKVKVSHNLTFPQPVTSEGTEACLLDDGDALVGAHLATRQDRILLASSAGFAIVFPLRELRPQGRKATGVRGIGLRNDAVVVGSLLVAAAPELALVTARGFAKRMAASEFRSQSRAGLGLVAAKLAKGDRVAAVAGCAPSSDLLLLTDAGRTLRIPAEAVPIQGRSTRGARVIDLAEGEQVCGLSRFLPSAFEPPPPAGDA